MPDDSPERQLRSQYELAVAEYRFQVELNWRRSEYFFVLNVGVLIAALSLFSSDRAPQWLVALLFFVGALLAGLSVLANETQHGYYTAARDNKTRLEQSLGLEASAITTTPGMGSRVKRLGKVGTFLKTMLIAIAVVDLAGGIVLLAEDRSTSEREVSLVVRVHAVKGRPLTTVAVSERGQLLATKSLNSQLSTAPILLEPGLYRVWADGPRICSRHLEVSGTPFQVFELTC